MFVQTHVVRRLAINRRLAQKSVTDPMWPKPWHVQRNPADLKLLIKITVCCCKTTMIRVSFQLSNQLSIAVHCLRLPRKPILSTLFCIYRMEVGFRHAIWGFARTQTHAFIQRWTLFIFIFQTIFFQL